MSARAWLKFIGMSLVWGLPYLLIKIAIDDGVPPVFVAWSRIALGLVVLAAVAWRPGVVAAFRGRVRWLLAFAIAELVIPFPLIAFGERYVTSSVAAILIAAAPLAVALLALRYDASERVGGRRLVGLVIGLVGVAVLVGVDVAGRPGELLGAVAVLLAAVGYAIAPMILRRHFSDLPPTVMMGAGLLVATVALAPAAALDPPSALPSVSALVALAILGLVCTAGALVLFGSLIVEVGASRALVITYLNPVVAVALGMAILDERPGPGAIAGLALILSGSWLSTDGRLPPGPRALVSRWRGKGGHTAEPATASTAPGGGPVAPPGSARR